MKTRIVVLIAGVLALVLLAATSAAAATRIEKNLKLEPGGRFLLDSVAGSVTINGSAGSGVKVVITADGDDLEEKVSFAFEESPGEARVIAKKKGEWGSWFGGLRLPGFRYEIQVPSRTALQVSTGGGGISVTGTEGDAKLDTSGGPISVADLKGKLAADTSGGGIKLRDVHGPAEVDTSGGGIEVEGIDGPLSAETSGGPIRIARAASDVHAETSGGGITIDEAGGRVEADTSGGGIEVIFAAGNSKGGRLETSGGGIRVKLDSKASLKIDASSTGGSVVSDLPITVVGEIRRTSITGTIGGGGELLLLRTSGGSIRIASR